MRSCSLVAKRWRRRSQQRLFSIVLFAFYDFARWEINIPQDTDGIPSYVHHVRFNHLPPRLEPGTLSRVLKSFPSLVSLEFDQTKLPPPAELAVPLSLGEFGNGITRLILIRVYGPFDVITSFVFSLPNLKELVMTDVEFEPGGSPPIVPDASRRGPLELFMVQGRRIPCNALALWKLASRRLLLNPSVERMELLIGASSETMELLTLRGMRFLGAFEKQNLY
jgi:hypothetical protein